MTYLLLADFLSSGLFLSVIFGRYYIFTKATHAPVTPIICVLYLGGIFVLPNIRSLGRIYIAIAFCVKHLQNTDFLNSHFKKFTVFYQKTDK